MKKLICESCNYMFEPDMMDIDGAVQAFDKLPEDWKCPSCGGGKSEFKVVEVK